jgi:colanic acid biosynthesis glycosyl transferase WcaI
LAIWLAERLEWSSYQQAGAVWAVTDGIRQTLTERGLSGGRVFVLPNGVDLCKFTPMDKTSARAALGWGDDFTVLYAGTIGLAHGLATVLDAALRLRSRTDIRIVLIGDGAARAGLVVEAQRRGITNVTFLDPQPHNKMPLVISASDACLVSLRRVPLFEGAIPSKVYEAMASARPIVLAVDGEARRLVAEQAQAGIYVDPENPSVLAEAIVALHDNPELAAELGQHGRAFVEAHFDRDMLTSQLEEHLAAVLEQTRPRKPVAGTERSAYSAPELQQVP